MFQNHIHQLHDTMFQNHIHQLYDTMFQNHVHQLYDTMFQNHVHQLESSLSSLQTQVQHLSDELAARDARILELSSLLPWTQDERTGQPTLILQSEDGEFDIGENEFVV